MADENVPSAASAPSVPPADGGAEDLIEFTGLSPLSGDAEARSAYLDECRPEADDAEPPEEDAAEAGAPPDFPASRIGSLAGQAWGGIGPHLDELRRRLVVAACAFVPAFALGLYFYRELWDFLLLPLADASPHLLRFQALAPSDGLVLAMRIAFGFALVVSTPVWIGQVWSFVAPGLTGREKKWLYLSFGAGGLLFLAGAAIAYLYAVPLALAYLLPLNQSLAGWENSFTGSGYVEFIATCCVAFGLAFETPLVMMALGWAGLLTPEGIRSWWRAVVLAVFLLAAIMTPPDPFTLLLLALPMLGLFLLGYLLVRWTAGRRK